MILPVIEFVPVAALLIPEKNVAPVVVPLTPTAIEFAVAVLPMVLEEIVKFPAAPAVLIPKKLYTTVAVAPKLIPPMLLF